MKIKVGVVLFMGICFHELCLAVCCNGKVTTWWYKWSMERIWCSLHGPANPIWAPASLSCRSCFILFLDFKQNRWFFLITCGYFWRIDLGLQLSYACGHQFMWKYIYIYWNDQTRKKTNPAQNSCLGSSQKQNHPSDKPVASCN